MANKWSVLAEKDKYRTIRRSLDSVNSELYRLIISADAVFDGKSDKALVSILNNCKSSVHNLQSALSSLESQLSSLAYRLDEEQKRLEREREKARER